MQEPKIKSERLKLVAIYYCGEALGNAERAAVMAGYSARYARGNAYKLIQRNDVKAYIEYLNSLTKDNIVGHISTISEIQAFWSNIMNGGENEIKDRLRASELLAKAQGAFNNEW